MTGPVLLIEDDDALRTSLAQTIELGGLTPLAMANFVQARRSIRANFAGVVLTDIRMPHQDGFDVLGFAQNVDPDLPVILMTGHSDVPTAMRAMKAGAWDYLEKPCSTDRLLDVLGKALDHRALVLKSRRIERALLLSDAAALNFPGSGAATTAFCTALRQVAATRQPVHLFGAEGVGKKLSAYVINQLMVEPCAFLRLNLRDAPADAVRRLEVTAGPVDLSCKNLDHATPEQQHDLLALVERHADLRLLTSAVTPLAGLAPSALTDDPVLAGRTVEIRVPTLDERREDLPEIFEYLLRQTVRSFNGDMPDVPESLTAEILTRPWPGNLPELRGFAMSFALGRQVQGTGAGIQPLTEQIDAFERLVLIETLRRTGGRAAEAARALGVARNTFYDRLARYGLSARDYRAGEGQGTSTDPT